MSSFASPGIDPKSRSYERRRFSRAGAISRVGSSRKKSASRGTWASSENRSFSRRRANRDRAPSFLRFVWAEQTRRHAAIPSMGNSEEIRPAWTPRGPSAELRRAPARRVPGQLPESRVSASSSPPAEQLLCAPAPDAWRAPFSSLAPCDAACSSSFDGRAFPQRHHALGGRQTSRRQARSRPNSAFAVSRFPRRPRTSRR
jgi:hypothetical protein